ncbi:MAG: ABC transporter permease, partial [Candidatus Cloacimonetes bacterium]|nr:ABC transporter permease [Candidatus Cloacimonadota bacterium]
LSLLGILQVIGLIILNVFSSTSIIFCIVTLMKTEGAFQTFSTILGTVLGFITGIYVPIGVLSEPIQALTKFVPVTYGVALTRQVFMQEPITRMFAGAPDNVVAGFEKYFGSQVYYGGYQCPPLLMIFILLFSGFAFIGLSVMIVDKKK